MSRDVKSMVLAKAIELWRDPESRAIGTFSRKDESGLVQRCAIQVLSDAREMCGIKRRDLPAESMARWIVPDKKFAPTERRGAQNALITQNDQQREAGQALIYEWMKKALALHEGKPEAVD